MSFVSPAVSPAKTDDQVLQLHTEELAVSRRKIVGDTICVTTVTRERERTVDENLNHERVEIERVPIGRIVDAVPAIREEDDTTIMPVVEEILVVERRLILKEEVRIRRIHVSDHHRETVTLREQEAVITRVKPENSKLEDVHQPLGNKLTPSNKPTPNRQEKLK